MTPENELTNLVKKAWGDNAVEFLVGALFSVTTPSQIEALTESLRGA
jgi:hypothetical protein